MIPQKNGLDVGIVTGNLAAMLEFYQDLLEIPAASSVTIPGVGLITKLRFGASEIKILSPEQRPDHDRRETKYSAVAGLRYFTLTIENLAGAVERCREAGVKILVDIVSPRPGVSAAMIEDPDGNAIELMQIEVNHG